MKSGGKITCIMKIKGHNLKRNLNKRKIRAIKRGERSKLN